MVYTVTLNPAIDYIVSPAKFAAGEINRYQKAVYGPGERAPTSPCCSPLLGVRNRALGICAGFSGGDCAPAGGAGLRDGFRPHAPGPFPHQRKGLRPGRGRRPTSTGRPGHAARGGGGDCYKSWTAWGRGIPWSWPGASQVRAGRHLCRHAAQAGGARRAGRGGRHGGGPALCPALQAVSGKAQQRRAGELFGVEIPDVGTAKGICQAAGAGRREKRGGLHGGQGRAAGG